MEIVDVVLYHANRVQIFEDVKNFRDDDKEGDRRRIFFDWKCPECDILHSATFFGIPYMIDRHQGHVAKSAAPREIPPVTDPKARVN